MSLNEDEIDRLREQHRRGHPLLQRATFVLSALRHLVNYNWSGWARCKSPNAASQELQELIVRGGEVTEAEFQAALAPVQAFVRKHRADWKNELRFVTVILGGGLPTRVQVYYDNEDVGIHDCYEDAAREILEQFAAGAGVDTVLELDHRDNVIRHLGCTWSVKLEPLDEPEKEENDAETQQAN